MIIKKQKLDHSRLKSIILKYKIFSLLTKNSAINNKLNFLQNIGKIQVL
jgi:hypothetical protein